MTDSILKRGRVLSTLNSLAVGLALAAITSASFAIFDKSLHPFMIAPPTLVTGSLWAASLRGRPIIGEDTLSSRLLTSLAFAGLNTICAGASWFVTPMDVYADGLPSLLGVFAAVCGPFIAVSFGSILWVPALVMTLLCFGLPIELARWLARKGLAGKERGELVVGIASALMSLWALVVFRVFTLECVHEEMPRGAFLIPTLAVAGGLAGVAAAVLASAREWRRRALLSRIKAGEVPGMRVEDGPDGPALVRVASERAGYRAVDHREVICLLDASGRVTHSAVHVRSGTNRDLHFPLDHGMPPSLWRRRRLRSPHWAVRSGSAQKTTHPRGGIVLRARDEEGQSGESDRE